MKIEKFSIVHLRNAELYQFFAELKQLVEKAGADALHIEELYAVFLGLFERMDMAMERLRKSMYTKELAHLDAVREKVYHGFVLLARAHLYSVHGDRADAARRIMILVDDCGDLQYKPYTAATAAVHIFLNELRDRCADAVELLGATGWLHDLETANSEFDGLMQIRFDERTDEGHINLRATRREAEKVYSQIVGRIHAVMALGGEEACAVFVEQLNRRVVYCKNTIAQRKGRAEAKSKKEAMPREEASPDVAPGGEGLPES